MATPFPPEVPGALLFDAGMTLLFSRTSTVDMTAAILRRRGYSIAAPDLHHAMRAADRFIESRWHVGPWWLHESAVRDLFTAGYRDGLARLQALPALRAEIPQLAEAIYEAYADPDHWELYADVLPALEGLQALGIPMGIVSDWGESLTWLIHHLGIADAFKTVVVSSRLGLGKPDPGLFLMAVSRLGMRPNQVWYIGDTYTKDVLGARSAGLHPILIDRDSRHFDLDCPVIRSLVELLAPVNGKADRSIAL